MKKHLSTLALLATFLLSGCGGGASTASDSQTQTPGNNQTPTAGTPTTIRLIEMNDLHAHLVPHADKIRDEDGSHFEMRGGIAKIATVIKALRAENNASILMNIGDTFHGGAEATFSLGNAIVDSVNALGVDIGVVGNWDFAYGTAVTELRFTNSVPNTILKNMTIGDTEVKRPNYEVIAANWFTITPSGSSALMVSPTKMITKNGVKIGMIGLTSDIVARMHPSFALGMDFTQGKEAYISLINTYVSALKNSGAHIIVVLSELGIHKDVALAQSINPGVDVFFSAHTHELTKEPLKTASGALVVEPGNDGYLGVMDIEVLASGEKKFNWIIKDITQEIEDDAQVAQIVEKDRAPFVAQTVNIKNPLKQSSTMLTASIETVLADSPIALDRRGLLENSFNSAFAEVLRKQANTQLSITPGFRFDSVIDPEMDYVKQGSITIEDVYRFFPSAYTLATATVSGEHLHDVYESMLTSVVSKDAFEQSGGWVECLGGVAIRTNIDNENSQRVLSMQLLDDNTTLQNDTLYTIAGCTRPGDAEDVLCSYSGFGNKKDMLNPSTNLPYAVSDFFIDILKYERFHPIIQHNVTDESQVDLDTGFIQPLWE